MTIPRKWKILKQIFLPVFFSTILFSSCNKKEIFWNEDQLCEAVKYCEEIGTFALVIQTDNNIVASYGDIDSLSKVHSIRKAILMAFISQHLPAIV